MKTASARRPSCSLRSRLDQRALRGSRWRLAKPKRPTPAKPSSIIAHVEGSGTTLEKPGTLATPASMNEIAPGKLTNPLASVSICNHTLSDPGVRSRNQLIADPFEVRSTLVGRTVPPVQFVHHPTSVVATPENDDAETVSILAAPAIGLFVNWMNQLRSFAPNWFPLITSSVYIPEKSEAPLLDTKVPEIVSIRLPISVSESGEFDDAPGARTTACAGVAATARAIPANAAIAESIDLLMSHFPLFALSSR
jgi:hypothetical protein